MLLTTRQKLVDSGILLGLSLVFFIVSYIRFDYGNKVTNILCCSDPRGYYTYLPAVFIYKDIHALPADDFVGRRQNEKGEVFTKFSCGTAYFYLPFFLGAHLYAHLAHADTSGYSAPYNYGILFAGIFWGAVGLYLLKRLLLNYFSRSVTWLTLLSIVAGTNFLDYITLDVGMSHVYNFTLFAAAISVVDAYYKNPGRGKAILLGTLCGWIVLSRPTNIAVLIFLILYRVVTVDDIKLRIAFIKKHIGQVFLAGIFFAIVWIPQLLYWKSMTGHWIKYSYEEEGFIYWKNPKLLLVLIDTENGWLLYSPILLFLFWAWVKKRKDPRTNFLGTASTLVIITYIFASWWAWTFGGAFGHRCYIDYYPLLAFPLAVTMEAILNQQRLYKKVASFTVIVLLCYYSVALQQLYMLDGRPFEGPEWKWNWDSWIGVTRKVFGLPPTHPE